MTEMLRNSEEEVVKKELQWKCAKDEGWVCRLSLWQERLSQPVLHARRSSGQQEATALHTTAVIIETFKKSEIAQ